MAELVTNKRDIDLMIREVQERLPEAQVRQLRVSHPADDDNLWTFYLPHVEQDIQIEGPCLPFLVETNAQCCHEALKATTVDETVAMIVMYLSSARDGLPRRLVGRSYWP